MRITTWQATEMAKIMHAHDQAHLSEEGTESATAEVMMLDDYTGEIRPDGSVLGLRLHDGSWHALWIDGDDVSDEYVDPLLLRAPDTSAAVAAAAQATGMSAAALALGSTR